MAKDNVLLVSPWLKVRSPCPPMKSTLCFADISVVFHLIDTDPSAPFILFMIT